MLINHDGNRCLFIDFMSQELLVTVSFIIEINHFQPEIRIMITVTKRIVPVCVTEPGGTTRVTNPT